MARPRKPSANTASNTFGDALKFVATICKDQGSINETHVHIHNGWITAFNGTLGIGHPTDNTLFACPQIKLLIEALSKCGQNIAITQLDNNRLSIKSEKFKAIIPCLATDLLVPTIPDPIVTDIDDRLKEALVTAGELPNENGQYIYNVSVLLDQGSVISSLGGTLLYQHWHGIDLPPLLSIPKALCTILGKINKKLIKFGYGQSSVTFYFENNSWLRSQLYPPELQWPDIKHVFDCTNNLQQFPADFWAAVAAVAPFGEGLCHARDGRLCSHAQAGAGAEYECPGLVSSWCFPARQLAFLKPWATHCDFQAQSPNGVMLYAVGKSARAVVAGISQRKEY